MEIDKINNFWLFFEMVASDLLINSDNSELINCLDNEVNKLTGISWEYGPTDNGLYFCLSPSFRFELIPFVEFAISLSPNLPGWTFVSGKPPKSELLEEFSFINDDGSQTFINTRNWYAVVYKFDDCTCDIDFIVDVTLDTNTSYLALNTAMVNLLGEINYMRRVNEIRIVEKFDSNIQGKGIQFKDLVNVIV